jgi:DNA-binding NtrC family response regulator
VVSHFLLLFANEMGMTAPSVTPETMELLEAYTFPGNVRELKNVIERALIESGGEPIRRHHIHLLEPVPRRQTTTRLPDSPGSETIPLNLDAAEQVLIQRALVQAGATSRRRRGCWG